MGQQIANGIDTKIAVAENITGTDAGWADAVTQVLVLLKELNNLLGSAALVNTGTSAGNIPLLGAGGLLATSLLNATATGGAATDAGKVALLNSAGQLASTMIGSSGGGGGGLKHLSFYNGIEGPGNSNRGTLSGRQYLWTGNNKWTKPTNVSSLLIVATGAGGSGSFGPDSTGPNPDGSNTPVHGRNTRKGGGGAGGSTAIVFIPTPLSDYDVRIGLGGDTRLYNQTLARHGGASTQFGASITAQGGNPGASTGNGGTPRSATPGSSTHGEGILGGQGHDGTEAVWGGGSGGSSFWGGSYSGGGGLGVPVAGVISSAPGSGGGAAHGTSGSGTPRFTPRASGHPGNAGALLILGFG